MPVLSTKTRAYLIGGDGFHMVFWPSLVAAVCITHPSFAAWGPLSTVHAYRHEAYEYLLDKLMRGSHKMMWWSVFGLLSSSCCAVQLILNLFNFGCAGFNTYLGPLRPMFLAITITLNVRMWELAMPNLGLPSTPDHYLPSIIASTILAIFLSVLPEITELRNRRNMPRPAMSEASADMSFEMVFSLVGLGCVACTSAVQGAVNGLANKSIVGISVALEEKEAKVTVSCDEDEARNSVAPLIISQIEGAGFEASLQSINKCKAKGEASSQSVVDEKGTGASKDFFSALTLGLLSSSCCLLQLGVNLLATLNVAHVGCAGFNKVLGPYRLHIRTLTFGWLAYLWSGSIRGKDCCKVPRGRLLFNTMLCLLLTFLPELLRMTGGNAIAPPTTGAKLLKFQVDGMGCEACETHVRGVMERSSGVISSVADFEKGWAEVEVADNWGFDVATVMQKLKEDGYEAKMVES